MVYEHRACPGLRAEGFYEQIISIGANGCGCTSSPSLGKWRHHPYDYVEPDGRRIEIPDSGWGDG